MAKRLTVRGWVGREIRRARESADPRMTRRELGERLRVSAELVAAWESGRHAVHVKYLDDLTSALTFPPGGELLTRVVVDLVNGETHPEFEADWLAAERRATTLWDFESGVVPGLLQTPDYARGILATEYDVTRRLERQRILDDDVPPTLVAVLSEAVLHLAVGGPGVMAAQLAELVNHAEREHVFVHIVPMREPVSGKFVGPFMLAALDDGRSVAYGETVIGSGDIYAQPEHVAEIRALFERFRAHALPERESIDMIREAVEQWKS